LEGVVHPRFDFRFAFEQGDLMLLWKIAQWPQKFAQPIYRQI
jgi:hypothetical protein